MNTKLVRISLYIGVICILLGYVLKVQLKPETTCQKNRKRVVTEELLPELLKELSSSESCIRSVAALQLQHLKTKAQAAVPQLIPLTADRDASVRWRSLAALGHIGLRSPDVEEAIIAGLDDSHQTSRINALFALNALKIENAESKVIPLLASNHKTIRFKAARYLNSFGTKGSKEIARAFSKVIKQHKAESPQYLFYAIESLELLDAVPDVIPIVVMNTKRLPKKNRALIRGNIVVAKRSLQALAEDGASLKLQHPHDVDISRPIACLRTAKYRGEKIRCGDALLAVSAYINDFQSLIAPLTLLPDAETAELAKQLIKKFETAQKGIASETHRKGVRHFGEYSCPQDNAFDTDSLLAFLEDFRLSTYRASVPKFKTFLSENYFQRLQNERGSQGKELTPSVLQAKHTKSKSFSHISCPNSCVSMLISPSPRPTAFEFDPDDEDTNSLHFYKLIREKNAWKLDGLLWQSFDESLGMNQKELRQHFEQTLSTSLCQENNLKIQSQNTTPEAHGNLLVKGAVEREIYINGRAQFEPEGTLEDIVASVTNELFVTKSNTSPLNPFSMQGSWPIRGGLKKGRNKIKIELKRNYQNKNRTFEVEVRIPSKEKGQKKGKTVFSYRTESPGNQEFEFSVP